MRKQQRGFVPGETRFFTLATGRRRPHFRNPLQVQRLRTALRQVMAAHPFCIRAMVVLPDHLHCLWTLPAGDDDFTARWRRVRLRTSRAAGIAGFWEPGWRERPIVDAEQLRQHIDRIHYDPVRHSLVERPSDWPWSSYRHRSCR